MGFPVCAYYGEVVTTMVSSQPIEAYCLKCSWYYQDKCLLPKGKPGKCPMAKLKTGSDQRGNDTGKKDPTGT
jgi:hypothetical protein